MTVLVFLDPAYPDGRIADASRPALLATDQGATRGDGIFDSMLAVNGVVRKLQSHLSRLVSSAAILELEIPAPDRWKAAISTAMAQWEADPGKGNEAVVKLIATRGPEGQDNPTAWVQVSAVPAAGRKQREAGLDVLLLDRGYDSTIGQRAPWLLMGAKTLSYAVNMAALRYVHEQGADDAIFTSSDGRVLEGPTSSVLLAHYGNDGGTLTKRLITPALDSGILPGTTQGALFKAAKDAGWELGYGPLVPDDLFDADAVWLTSSIRLLAPVKHIDGRPVGSPEVSARLTAELNQLLETIG